MLKLSHPGDGGGVETEDKFAAFAVADRPRACLAHPCWVAHHQFKRGDGADVPGLHVHGLAVFPCPLVVRNERLADVRECGLLGAKYSSQEYIIIVIRTSEKAKSLTVG